MVYGRFAEFGRIGQIAILNFLTILVLRIFANISFFLFYFNRIILKFKQNISNHYCLLFNPIALIKCQLILVCDGLEIKAIITTHHTIKTLHLLDSIQTFQHHVTQISMFSLQ